jgi:hypothetical protein
MFQSRLLPGVAVFLAAGAALTACGGESGDPGTLSKGDFASEANDHCAKTQDERTRLLQQLPPQPSGQADAQTVQRIAAGDRELIRRVDALPAPPAEQDDIVRVLDGWRQRAELEEQYAGAVGAAQAPQSLEAFSTQAAQIDATVAPIATELGMTQCTGAAP